MDYNQAVLTPVSYLYIHNKLLHEFIEVFSIL